MNRPKDIVISGMAGKAANANNTQEIKDQIYNKKDMIGSEPPRFQQLANVPSRYGLMPGIDKFDCGFFGIPQKHAGYMDPANRTILEVACEAILDAGLNKRTIQTYTTGIYVGTSYNEFECICWQEPPRGAHAFKGAMKTCIALRIAHFLGVNGPTITLDTACASTGYAIDHAVRDLQIGKCDIALVCGNSLILSPTLVQQFFNLGILSRDGKSKSFDATANGYARSECSLCLVLQREDLAKRSYAKVVRSLTTSQGFNEMGITNPSLASQITLLEEFYEGFDSNKIGFFEAHGTGTRVGDPIELTAFEKYFFKTRTEPMLVGTIKANLGHCESGSCLSSVIKSCFILESGLIAPNINFHTPNPASSALLDGKLKVVTETTPLPADKPFIAISNFGFGGANSHLLLTKGQEGQSRKTSELPGLICVCGRTIEAVKIILDKIKKAPDADFLALLNSAFQSPLPEQPYRCFALIDQNGVSHYETLELLGDVAPLKCAFSNNACADLGPQLMKFEIFKNHLQECSKFVNFNKDLNFTSTVIVQTGIAKLLKALKVDIEKFIGEGIGQLAAVYANGITNLEDSLQVAYWIDQYLSEHENICEKTFNDQLQAKFSLAKQGNWRLLRNANNNWALANGHKVSAKFAGNLLLIDENILQITSPLIDTESNKDFLKTLGKLYLLGYEIDVNSIYSINWPVKPGTPMISPLVKWDHRKSWQLKVQYGLTKMVKQVTINLKSPLWHYLYGHGVDGRTLFPAPGYIYLIWEAITGNCQVPVSFENVQFLRPCSVSQTTDLILTVQICKISGNFEISEGNMLAATGKVARVENIDNEWVHLDPLPHPSGADLMNKRDIYKEFGLRKLSYDGVFTEVHNANTSATVAHLRWTKWVSFIENMMQLKMLNVDTRNICITNKIDKILIHPQKHLTMIRACKDPENFHIPIYYYKELDVIRCDFVEIRGLSTSIIRPRKSPKSVLESHQFIPYVGKLDFETAIRVITQIVLENSNKTSFKVLEVLKYATKSSMLPLIQQTINDRPLIQASVSSVHNVEMGEKTNFDITIGSNLSEDSKLHKTLCASLNSDGFLISRETLGTKIYLPRGEIVCEYSTPQEKIVVIRVVQQSDNPKIVDISGTDFSWLGLLKEAFEANETLLLHANNEPNSGLLGLSTSLRKEFPNKQIMTMLINGNSAPKFNPSDKFYSNQLLKKLFSNIYKDGMWGSYRDIPLNQKQLIKTTHSFVKQILPGDMSSFCWRQGILSISDTGTENADPGMSKVHIYICALNHRDLRIAKGSDHGISEGRTTDESILGIEFAGRCNNGARVMGLGQGAMSSLLQVRNNLLWSIPDSWTMEDASTVPWVYLTNIYGLLMRAKLCQGESVLVHSATGGIGLSAINIALHNKCTVFVTVSNKAKRNFLLKEYPQIPAAHIGQSRDLSFYEMILRLTQGKGVQVIVNTLLHEKLFTSIKCLQMGGRFIDLGKVDMISHNSLSTDLAEKDAEYHGINMDQLLSGPASLIDQLRSKLNDGIKEGWVRPLPRRVYESHGLEEAFRYMATGEHYGKLLVKIRNEEQTKLVVPAQRPFDASYKLHCYPTGSYIILGGLEGFGLELADFLILRGARFLVLVAPKTISTGYQEMRLRRWKSYKCNVNIAIADTSTMEGCTQVLKTAQSLGDIKGIFDLTHVQRDATLAHQTVDSFQQMFNIRTQSTIYLDKLSREMAPSLEQFVIFSTISVSHGKVGQTNYGYCNSAVERVCENRSSDKLPAKVVLWGVEAEGCSSAEQNQVVVEGVMPQKISSCLEIIDVLLGSEATVVSSMIMAEKEVGGVVNAVSIVAKLLQLDVKNVGHHLKLSELGMDSVMVVEIAQTLESDLGLALSAHDLRNMTLTKLKEMSSEEE